MLDALASFFLLFGKEVIIAPLCIIGFFILDRAKWGRAIYLIFFTMLLAPFLKSIWQKPLPIWLSSDGWAFPSGHFLVSMSLYSWIAHEYRNKALYFVVMIILIGIGYGLIYKGYHDIEDVAGAAFFSSFALIGYYKLNKLSFFIKRPDLLIMIFFPLSILLLFLLPVISPMAIQIVIANILFGISWVIFSHMRSIQKSNK